MTGIEYLEQVQKEIDELTDEEFIEIFGYIYDENQQEEKEHTHG